MAGRVTGLNTGGLQAFAPSGITDLSTNPTEASVTFLSPNVPIVARDFSVKVSVAPGAGKHRFFKIRVNGVSDNSWICDVDGTATTCSAPAAQTSQVIPAHSDLTMFATTIGNPPAAEAQFGWRATVP
jgi:hypothetical protein